jgi:HK97 family phage major capsid protein/HK97 family phage prohead protease
MEKYFTRYQKITPQTESDRLTFSFSSETPVNRGIGNEILSHSPEAINLERCQNAPLLWNHNWDRVLGKVERVWVERGKGYCEVRWSKSEQAQAVRAEVEDGIISNVSLGYSVETVRDGVPEKGSYTVTRWTPYEISLVAVPADPTVGINRVFLANMEHRNSKGIYMETTLDKNDIIRQERERVQAITNACTRHGFKDLIEPSIEGGKSIEEVRSIILDRLSNAQTPVAQGVDPLGLSAKEEKTYSIVRAINAAINNDWSKAGFERECSQEIAQRANREPKGFYVPTRDLKYRAPYAVGAPETGGNLVQTDLLAQNFIELLRNKAMVIQAGAMMLTGLQGPVAIPKQATSTTVYWVDEGEAITQSEATFTHVTLKPKTVGVLSEFSRLMLLQPSIDIEQFIRNDFARIMAIGIDSAAIAGTAVDNQPRGILNTSGIGSVALGTNGGVPTWQSIVNLKREIAIDNADTTAMRFMANPAVEAKLMTTPKQSSGVEGNFILADPGTSLCGYPFLSTNQVPSNLTKGSGTNLSALILGTWSDLIIGEWGVLEILPNPYGAGYASGNVTIRAMQTIDIAVRYPQSFAAITDMTTT